METQCEVNNLDAIHDENMSCIYCEFLKSQKVTKKHKGKFARLFDRFKKWKHSDKVACGITHVGVFGIILLLCVL